MAASLENQIATQRIDLIKAASDLDAAVVCRTSLENKIEILNQTVIDQTDRAKIPSLQERFEEMELIVVELARRAESAETSLSLLIDSGTKQHEVLEERIMPSESAPSHPSTAASIHQIGDFNSDFNGLAESQRYSSNPTRSKVEFNVFPSVGSEGISSESCDQDLASSEYYRSINSRQTYTEDLSANRHKEKFLFPHESVGHRRVTGTDNGVTKKSSAGRKFIKASSKSKSIGSTSTASKVKSCPHMIDSRGKDCNASRTAVELSTPRTASQSRNASLGSDYGNYIREVKSVLPSNSMKKCTPSVLREKNSSLGHKSRSIPRFESSPSPARDPHRQRHSNATRNVVETKKTSTKHYDLGRGDGAPMINLAAFHTRQASPYRSRSAAPSTVLERYISTPIMKSSARGAATTPSVIERAGRHKLQVWITTYSNVSLKETSNFRFVRLFVSQVTIPSGYAAFPFRV